MILPYCGSVMYGYGGIHIKWQTGEKAHLPPSSLAQKLPTSPLLTFHWWVAPPCCEGAGNSLWKAALPCMQVLCETGAQICGRPLAVSSKILISSPQIFSHTHNTPFPSPKETVQSPGFPGREIFLHQVWMRPLIIWPPRHHNVGPSPLPTH